MNAARAAFVALLLCFSCAAAADVAVPPLSGRVVDQTGTLSSGDVAVLTQTLKDLETRKGHRVLKEFPLRLWYRHLHVPVL